jgi:hypothetical protein
MRCHADGMRCHAARMRRRAYRGCSHHTNASQASLISLRMRRRRRGPRRGSRSRRSRSRSRSQEKRDWRFRLPVSSLAHACLRNLAGWRSPSATPDGLRQLLNSPRGTRTPAGRPSPVRGPRVRRRCCGPGPRTRRISSKGRLRLHAASQGLVTSAGGSRSSMAIPRSSISSSAVTMRIRSRPGLALGEANHAAGGQQRPSGRLGVQHAQAGCRAAPPARRGRLRRPPYSRAAARRRWLARQDPGAHWPPAC